MHTSLRSFFLGGFECSAHKRPDGRRLDLLASTGHERLASQDYTQLHAYGLRTVRDGVRWHRVERRANYYDWSSWWPMLTASHRAGVQVIWDLCHYGWPDHLDIWSVEFVDSFARYARAAARVIRDCSDAVPYYCPVNELSFWAWAGGDVAQMNPCSTGRGGELKRQLVRASIAAIEAIREVDARARFIVAEPLINVVGNPQIPGNIEAAEHYRISQFEAHDMLIGQLAPELGGRPEYLDIIGVNFYPDNQWYWGGTTIPLGHHAYRSLNDMLLEVARRYARPILISETGAEGSARPYWMHHVCAEVLHAIQRGADIQGICLYPILDYHGWDNDRACSVGLLSLPNEAGKRGVYGPLLEELRRQGALLAHAAAAPDQLAG